MIEIIELFSGIGTQIKAFKNAGKTLGIDIYSKAISEINPIALKGYEILNGEYNNLGDITKIVSLPKADIWTYSFPCTNLSIAGKKQGLSGDESSLIFEVVRLLETSTKPQVLIMENVKNLVNKTFIGGFLEFLNTLKEYGYTTYWNIMKACDFGGGTIRERVFAVSVLSSASFIFPNKIGTKTTVRDLLEPPLPAFYIDEGFQYTGEKNFSKAIKIRDYKNGGQGNRIYSIDGQGITLTATGGGKGGSSGLYLRDEGIYKLSGIEMARLMGWERQDAINLAAALSDRELGFLMGNAIDLKVMTILATSILEFLCQTVDFL